MLPKRDRDSTGLNSFTVTPSMPSVPPEGLFLRGLLDGVTRLCLPGQGALLAVSGGADSMAMLHGLAEISRQCSVGTVVVAHLNHCLRGGESDADEQFVKETCSELGVQCVVERLEPGSLANHSRGSLEEAARKARYDFLTRSAQSLSLASILTAHHQQDQTETRLFNILRGTGLRGLGGIPECRELVGRLQIVRPMLRLSRTVIRDFLLQHGGGYREDSSNESSQYTRNQIRQALSSLPEESRGRLEDRLRRLGDQSGQTVNALDQLSRRILADAILEDCDVLVRLNCKDLAQWPEPIVRHVFVALWCHKAWPRQRMNAAHWERLSSAALTSKPCRWTLPDGVTLCVKRKVMSLLLERS